MTKIEKGKLEKIYQRIDAAAKLGKDGIFEYKKIIDEAVDNGQYYLLINCLERKYNIVCYSKPLYELKTNDFFNQVRSKTNSEFQENLYSYYKKNSVYQQGYNIFNSHNDIIGKIEELNEILIVTNSGNNTISITQSNLSLYDKYVSAIEYLLD